MPLLAVTACGSATAPSAISAPATRAPSAEQVTNKVALVTKDFTDGTKVKLLGGGNIVKDEVTLDYCGYTFTTEAHRIARQQVVLTTPDGKTEYSNEVVKYDNAAEAAKALNEVRSSAAHCPLNVFQSSTVAANPDLAYVLSRQVRNPNLPIQDNSVVTSGSWAKAYTVHEYSVDIYQRHGAVLDAIYMWPHPAITAQDLTSVQALATLAGKKLATYGN